jgi:hypothetical protein
MSETYEFIQWPAIIKLHADDELIYVPDAVQFASDVALQLTHLQAQDMMIDSSGTVYSIINRPALELTPTGVMSSLDEVEDLLRLHLSNNGTCCVSKFFTPSIRDALMSVFACSEIHKAAKACLIPQFLWITLLNGWG